MAVPYHTHTFEIPQATKADVIAGVSTDKAVVPAALGTAATKNTEDFATSAQGESADSAVQPSDLAVVATSGSYLDLTNLPTLGTAAAQNSTAFATALQGGKADTAVQPADIGSAAYQNVEIFATATQGAKADTAVQALGGATGQVLTKNSADDNDVGWQTVAAATAVSYAPQTLTGAQQGQAIANIGAGSLAGFRNNIINGNFDIWQRSTTQTTTGYGSDDRWRNENNFSTKVHSRQAFVLGQAEVPGQPRYYSRTIVSSTSGSNSFVNKSTRLEEVGTLSGEVVTLTFYAKANEAKNIAIEFAQLFGTGGTPSSDVLGIEVQTANLTVSWKRFDFVVTIPSVAGKTAGTDNNGSLAVLFWFDAGSNLADRTANLGHQSGTFDIARVSLVRGDASQEQDPFSPRSGGQEIDLCYRYYQKRQASARFHAASASETVCSQLDYSPMRTAPSASTPTGGTKSNVGTSGVVFVSSGNNNSARFEIMSASAGQAYWLTAEYSLDAEI